MQTDPNAGKILLVNGASSAGKSTLCRGLQERLDLPFWHYSIDHLAGAGILPWTRIRSGEFPWSGLRESFFAGFHASLPALAAAGNHLLVEHIVESDAWMRRLVELLAPFDVFFVGVHCPLDELERRERARGDRPVGDARRDFETCHTFGAYDFEIDATAPLDDNVAAVIAAWRARTPPGAFGRNHRADRQSVTL